MPTLLLTTLKDIFGGTEPTSAVFSATVYRGLDPAIRVIEDEIVFPDPLKTTLRHDLPLPVLALGLIPSDCYWRIIISVQGFTSYEIAAVFPVGPGPFTLEDLIVVDAATSLPDPGTPLATAFLLNIAESATEAQQAATSATASQGSAANSAAAAASSAASIIGDTTSAAASAASAGTSATNATTSATTATTKAASATASASSATDSATSATGSASGAATSATNAATSASQAATSATAASMGATTATNAAASITASAATATSQATAATTAATSATTSATSAATSATGAASSYSSTLALSSTYVRSDQVVLGIDTDGSPYYSDSLSYAQAFPVHVDTDQVPYIEIG